MSKSFDSNNNAYILDYYISLAYFTIVLYNTRNFYICRFNIQDNLKGAVLCGHFLILLPKANHI